MNWEGPGAGERLLVLAPHPDDETLAAGGLLQRVRARGGEVRVAFATDGENNPWTQRFVERRLRVRREDRIRFGSRRREEALGALSELGLWPDDAVFLGFPDQAITALLLSGRPEVPARLASLLSNWRPSIVVAPSAFDLHPDHSALAVLLRIAMGRAAPVPPPRVLSYLIHRSRGMPEPGAGALRFEPDAAERDRKRRAIERHATQLAVHRRKFLAFASRPEIFLAGDARGPADGLHPVRRVRLGADGLRLDLVLRPRLGSFGRPTMHVAWAGVAERRSLRFDLRWRRGGAEVKDAVTAETVGRAALRGGRGGGEVELPRATLPESEALYVKLERRFGFFDEGGWLEVGGRGRDDA